LETQEIQLLSALYNKYIGKKIHKIIALPPSGSYRKYYRITDDDGKNVIGVYNEDHKENNAFVSFTRHFIQKGLPVPALLAEDLTNNVYLLSDLGDVTLLKYISGNNDELTFTDDVIAIYKKVIDQLPLFQVKGSENLDYSVCYPRHEFDKQSMMWDLNYFKYYFLKLARIGFDEQKLEDDFQKFSDYLLQADCNYFLYRDFQSRNVMIVDGEPFFIDYQGGRKGALQYDIASLLFEAKTALPAGVRNELFEYYLTVASKYVSIDKKQFRDYYYGYVYIRLMQAMGAYGFRGLYEKKELFLQSIPKALEHLKWLHENVQLPIQLPEMQKVWQSLIDSDYIRQLSAKSINLTVSINSFSYKRGIPVDETLNGGGFVFDCRALTNPGRFEEYKQFTGKDEEVKAFFAANASEIEPFINNIISIVNQSVEKYISRGFANLMVNFGCTGGQHRSVYSAERLYKFLVEKYPDININIRHREQEFK
jgi:aminoglycoside/choline kinase family phosphotransferase